jgi:site-specific DNA recombinase
VQSSKAAIYCRTASTHSDDFPVIEIQRDTVRDFAFRQGYEACAEYSDDGFGGNSLDRPAFIQMQEDINFGKIDTVIVHRIDRIARDYLLLEKCLQDFKSKGIKVITVDGFHEFNPLPSIVELVRSKTNMAVSI